MSPLVSSGPAKITSARSLIIPAATSAGAPFGATEIIVLPGTNNGDPEPLIEHIVLPNNSRRLHRRRVALKTEEPASLQFQSSARLGPVMFRFDLGRWPRVYSLLT